jgi:hypothetical protein
MSLTMERTPRRELLRWRVAARQALERFDVDATSFSLVKCGENITYRVRRRGGDDLLLRIHRPVYHSAEEIGSELDWVVALGEAADLTSYSPLTPRLEKALGAKPARVRIGPGFVEP